MAEPETVEPPASLADQAKAIRASRQGDDAARREAWLADRAAQEASLKARTAAAKRIRAAAHAGKPADPADVILALGSSDTPIDDQ